MIVPMKKVTLLVLKKYELEAVGKLKKLGVVHIEHGTLKESKDRNAFAADFNAMEKVVNALSLYKGVYNEEKAVAEFGSGEGVFARAKAVLEENEKLNLHSEELQRDIQSLNMWGSFRRDELDELKSKGLFVYLCLAPEKRFVELKESFADCAFEVVSSAKGQVAFAVISAVLWLSSI